MLKKFATVMSLLLVLSAVPLLGHGGKTHVMGTVAEIDASHVVVKTQEGKSVTILLDKETKFRKGKANANAADLKVGDRVVVDVTGEGDKQQAAEIRLSSCGGYKCHEGLK